jgi:glycosyltransferase involved in cell wall biosynthesis
MEIRKIQRRKPRIAMIMDTWFPVHTGEQVYCAKLAEALANEHGFEVDIYTRAIDGKLTAEEHAVEDMEAIRVKRFGFSSHPWNLFMQLWFIAGTFFSLLRAGRSYRAYHAHTATSAVAMKMASWFTRVPTLLTVHGNNVFQRSWTLRKIIHRIMFLETKYSQEISIAENFLKAPNVNDPVLVIPYGVDTTPFEEMSSEKDPQRFNVLFVGRLDTLKGVDVLLDAAKRVIDSNGFIQSHKDFQLHLAGNGPDRKMLEERAARLGIAKYVRFHGLVSGDALVKLYKSSDLFVLPSRSEALPFAALEACAARLPLLATNVGDLRKLVFENSNGHLVEPDDVEELAYYLEHFASNPHLESMGQASYDLVSQEYTWDSTVQKMLRVYDSVMQAKVIQEIEQKEVLVSPIQLPFVLLKARASRVPHKGKSPLRFCMTVDLEQESAHELPREDSVLVPFLERFSEFCAQWRMPSTLFIQSDLLEPFAEELLSLHEGGHEVGVKLTKAEWVSLPSRKRALRAVRERLEANGFKDVRMLRAPLDLDDEEDLDLAHEAGFEFLPVSEDPDPSLAWKWGLPHGRMIKMNMEEVLKMSDEHFLAGVNRLRSYQKHHGMEPYLIFGWSVKESPSGEAFTELAKKLTFLKQHMDLEFMTLSQFCKSCTL